jgi:hypothetical protein
VPITLTSDAFEATITPERGADVVQVVDRATRTPLFAQSPTGAVGPGPAVGSMAEWLRGYPGGWQILVPNAGPEREHDGARMGFHGEAALASWTVMGQEATSCDLETYLLTSPLRLRRSIALSGDALTVTDELTNLSPDPVQTRIVQHPAFGSPFLDDESYLLASAAMVTDADAPGTLAAADLVGAPGDVLPAGPVAGSIRLPGPDSGSSLFAALTGFAAHEVTFCSPTRGLGVRLEWEGGVLPHAWFWIEANAGPGWPWFRRLYAVAVEPANVLPGEGGSTAHPRGGAGTAIAAGESLRFTTSLTRLALARD